MKKKNILHDLFPFIFYNFVCKPCMIRYQKGICSPPPPIFPLLLLSSSVYRTAHDSHLTIYLYVRLYNNTDRTLSPWDSLWRGGGRGAEPLAKIIIKYIDCLRTMLKIIKLCSFCCPKIRRITQRFFKKEKRRFYSVEELVLDFKKGF